MLSSELISMAQQIEGTGRLKAGKPVDLGALAVRLRTIAAGVSSLEAITVPANARVIPAEVRHVMLNHPAPNPASASDHVEALIASGRATRDRVTILHSGPMREDERMARQLVGQSQ